MKKNIISVSILFILIICTVLFASCTKDSITVNNAFSADTTSPAHSSSALPTIVLTPTPTPVPTDSVATFGFVGDILMMKSQISTAKKSDGSYDFTRSFEPMRELFNSVDIMVGNYEGTFGGAEYAYTQNIGDARPPTEDNPNPSSRFQEFSSPDELALNLKELGFDVLTTANNHCLDRDACGLYRTIDIIRGAGIYQTGTFLSKEDRETPLIIEVNGIKVGIIAATDSINSYNERLSSEEHTFAVARLYNNTDLLCADIQACRDKGAEFIIACVHWGDEYENVQDSKQEQTALDLIAYGVDAIVGSHPHVVQPIKWIEAERDGKKINVPVIYSLGNFISNMAPSPKDYGLFVAMELTKDASTRDINVTKLEYLPVYCCRQKLSSGERLHQTLPCYEDISRITAYEEMDSSIKKNIRLAREHVISICGTEAASLTD